MISTPTRMNVFLQRMLKRSDDEDEGEIVMVATQQQVEYSPRGKANWIKKFSISPTESKSFPAPPESPSLRKSNPAPIQRSATLPTPQAAQDLDRIIREFEINYLSPTKQNLQQEGEKTGKFVKRMVAAFEQKYTNAKDSKGEIEARRLKRRSMPIVSEQHLECRDKFLDETFVIKPAVEKHEDCVDSLNVSSSKLDDTIDLSGCSFAMDEGLSSTPVKLQRHLQENPPTAKTSDSTLRRERKPKIVGAFLKKPIEVEDTSIDWIPIIGKKLPRKHSFKKLLSILTGRKSSNKGSKLFCSQSQNNLNKEPVKEHHDSGYDDKSSSTSSLASLASFSGNLVHQENHLIDSDQRTTSVSTFQAPKATQDPLEVGEEDCFSDASSVHSKKIIFEDVPRSEVRLSLGPSFPLKHKITNMRDSLSSISTINSDDYDTEGTLAPSLPKHPFVSSRDELSEDAPATLQTFSQIEFLRTVPWNFREMTTSYDIPRNYASKSVPELFNSLHNTINSSFECPVYDVPRVKIPPRPKSSIYEDALSLKRRTTVDSVAGVDANFRSEYYAFQSEEEPHYATVKPRNIRILPSRDLLRSMGNFSQSCRLPLNHYQPFDQVTTF